MYGKFSDIFGRKYTFLFAIIIFEIGSVLSGAAQNMIMLIMYVFILSSLDCYFSFLVGLIY